jgi:hypothetical protein
MWVLYVKGGKKRNTIKTLGSATAAPHMSVNVMLVSLFGSGPKMCTRNARILETASSKI